MFLRHALAQHPKAKDWLHNFEIKKEFLEEDNFEAVEESNFSHDIPDIQVKQETDDDALNFEDLYSSDSFSYNVQNKQYECKICQKIFHRIDFMKTHLKIAHNQENLDSDNINEQCNSHQCK